MRPRFRFGGRRSESRRFLRSGIGGNGVPRADSTYAGGRRGKERAARHERSSDWRRGAQRPRPEASAPPTFRGGAAGRSAQRGTSGAATGGGGRSAPDPKQVRLLLFGGAPREGVRSEARAEQRLTAGGAAPPTRNTCASYFSGVRCIQAMK